MDIVCFYQSSFGAAKVSDSDLEIALRLSSHLKDPIKALRDRRTKANHYLSRLYV